MKLWRRLAGREVLSEIFDLRQKSEPALTGQVLHSLPLRPTDLSRGKCDFFTSAGILNPRPRCSLVKRLSQRVSFEL